MRFLIIDDEPQARTLLQVYMNEIGGHQLLRSCGSAIEAYDALMQDSVDFIFLDIKMPVISGIDFMKSLKMPPLVIFTTAYSDFALEGYALNVVDYLLKPIFLPRLKIALDKLVHRNFNAGVTAQVPKFYFFKAGTQLIKIHFDEILLIEGMQNYIKIHLKEKIHIVQQTMKGMEQLLPAHAFARVHKSYIVAIALITSVQGHDLQTEYRQIPIGHSYKKTLMKKLSNSF